MLNIIVIDLRKIFGTISDFITEITDFIEKLNFRLFSIYYRLLVHVRTHNFLGKTSPKILKFNQYM